MLLDYLCDPLDRTPLRLDDASLDQAGCVVSGRLVSASGKAYPIVDGIPRFAMLPDARETVESFGDEWNYFDFIDFKQNWLIHTIANTFGSTDALKDWVVVDAGAGSGSQSRWIAEAGARLVIALELSHSVDGVMRKNLDGLDNVEIVQCSIDQPPIRDAAITVSSCATTSSSTRRRWRTRRERCGGWWPRAASSCSTAIPRTTWGGCASCDCGCMACYVRSSVTCLSRPGWVTRGSWAPCASCRCSAGCSKSRSSWCEEMFRKARTISGGRTSRVY
ncbi:MAG: methyltransferase domain-containing protein [Zoogloeaceae bacterium]|nr:methyltransferase domain-containing protein [Zoogloeaceae bacterium]